MDNELIQRLNNQMQITLPNADSDEGLLQKLSLFINHLIKTDFGKLVFILYKTDINESKLKDLLKNNSEENASVIISRLIIEREKEKIISRNKFCDNTDFSEEEKW